MSNPSPQKQPETDKNQKSVTPVNCLLGSAMSGALAWGMYLLTSSIAQTYAHKPLLSSSTLAMNIASAVRTLVIGVCALGTGLFAVTTLGLMALAIQLIIQQGNQKVEE